MANPLVSIIVTVYNKQKYIEETINSVLRQTYPNYELIIVNDGSTDNSLNIIRNSFGTLDNVKIIDQANSGPAEARNRGYREVRGEFINYLDGDDLLYPGFLEQSLGYFQNHPEIDILHVSWDWIDDDGKKFAPITTPDPEDYLHDLLLGNIFVIQAILSRKRFLDQVGTMIGIKTEDWEYWVRCAKKKASFGRLDKTLVATRQSLISDRKMLEDQGRRFFEAVNIIFSEDLPPAYKKLKDLSLIRCNLILMQDQKLLGDHGSAEKYFNQALDIINNSTFDMYINFRYIRGFYSNFYLSQMIRLSLVLLSKKRIREGFGGWLWYLQKTGIWKSIIVPAAKIEFINANRSLSNNFNKIQLLKRAIKYEEDVYTNSLSIDQIKRETLRYISSLRVTQRGKFVGYKYSHSSSKPVLYATLAALLTKHLYGVFDQHSQEEIESILSFQREDGLFVDPVIDCKEAEIENWWGWKHLTLHALMTLSLYEIPARREIKYLDRFKNKDVFQAYLNSREWGKGVDNTSNELQNLGVMLQYARDFQNSPTADELLDILFETLDKYQDIKTGLYGNAFNTSVQLSLGVQAGYHFWLLYFYEDRPINHKNKIIDSILKTQNLLGGYGAKLNSSACEDIDSIDPLYRLSRLINYRSSDIQTSLQKAFPAILHNLNNDGGWVFRRNEPFTLGHPKMSSYTNESNLFFTWFRTLGLSYCLKGLQSVNPEWQYDWNFMCVPGHQFS